MYIYHICHDICTYIMHIIHDIVYYIYYICQFINLFYPSTLHQVKAKEKELKHKLRPNNTFLKAKDLNLPATCPREELHQFLIRVYGEYILPASMHSYTQVFCVRQDFT